MIKTLIMSSADYSKRTVVTMQAQYLCRYSPFDEILLTPELLAYYIYGNTATKEQINSIRRELKSCSSCERLATNCFKFKKDAFEQKDNYELLDCEYFELLMKTKVNNKAALLEHLYQVIRSMSKDKEVRGKKKVVGYMPISYFAEKEKISESTVIRYNKQLEEIGILYFVHGGYVPSKSAKYNNLYGLKKNKAHIDAYADTLGLADKTDNRSISVKYNWFIKNPGRYNRAEIRSLRSECEKYNQSNEYNKKNTFVLQKCAETDSVELRKYYLYKQGLIDLSSAEAEQIIELLHSENIYPVNDGAVKLTEVQREKVELGLAIPQDFLEESLAE